VSSIEAQALRTMSPPLRKLPAAWWDALAVERMGGWLKTHVPRHGDRVNFIYGAPLPGDQR
jgi:hypothetical protein